MASLQSLLTHPLDQEGEIALLKHFWVKDIPHGRIEAYRSYLRYYATECARLQFGFLEESQDATGMVAATHEDIVLIVRVLSLGGRYQRPEVRTLLRQHFPCAKDVAINRSVDFAMRVWLTMNVREERLHTPHTPIMQWDDVTTLEDFVGKRFPRSSSTNSAATMVQLDHTFTAATIRRLTGIDISWTPCLADHLRFDPKFKVLKIYPFKQILLDRICLLETANSKTEEENPRSPIPLSVLKETILSLNLLFPHWDTETANFMLEHHHTFHLDGPFDATRLLSISDFDHWRNRMLDLYQLFHSPPMGWRQLWADRRNPQQWYTFWLAIVILILTVIFGFISSVTSVMQTYYAREAWKLAQTQ